MSNFYLDDGEVIENDYDKALKAFNQAKNNFFDYLLDVYNVDLVIDSEIELLFDLVLDCQSELDYLG